MSRLFILGCGGHGKVVADIAIKMKKYKEIYFLDDKIGDRQCIDIPVIGNSYYSNFKHGDEVFIAIGESKIRQKMQIRYKELGIKIATLIHPSAIIGTKVNIGCGTVIMAGVVINSESYIGDGVIINTCASIDHDNRINDYVHISVGAHLAGTVTIGKHSWVGIGAVVSNNISVCEECVIGAGAVVVKNAEKQGVYIGIPASLKEGNSL